MNKHDETHVEVLKPAPEGIELTRNDFFEAQLDSLAEAKSPWRVLRENVKLCTVIFIVQMNGMVLGLEYSLLGALVGVQAFCKTMGHYDESTDAYAVRAWTLSLWAGLFGLMQFVGQLIAGVVADRFGRKKTIYLMSFNILIGVMTEILSKNYQDYTGAKILMGTATGLMQVVIPTYVAEVTPREIRGITIGLFAFMLTLGSLVGTLVIWGCNETWGADITDNRSWHVPLYVGLAIPVLTLVLMTILLPESPYWLVLKNRPQDAQRSLKSLHPNKSDAEVERLSHLLQYTVLKEREHRESTADASYLECFQGTNLQRTFCAMFPSLAQQLVGNQLVQSYSTYFFEEAGVSNSLFSSVIVSCAGLGAAIIAFFFVENKKVGRYNLVFWGVTGITLSMLGIGVIDSADHGNTTTGAGIGLVFFIAFFNAAVAVGPGVAGWSYAAESASARLRAKTATLGTGANAIIGTVTNIVIPFELDAIGSKTGYMFFGLGVICMVLIYLWIPDVTGRTYAQLDELFERRIPARKFKETECTGEYGASME
ncbi:hypothetical protein ASPZODRAFT_104447 [Penicilliopsis zonata CBS 506.65]|uniref:Major facilitator superfamily (MFS) profile domain-containing protein n=1 Tax=Penicilliopsis zonata CBS 506.65 TaxID=1073090 RepID=A0A1L9S6L6_9EURO|nr:hypothetical protein ASPZODRAFT_104447 [Penicilliopsis zonata CBS 506.65]OJJ42785.1 hypothetical protein ASPZODRAFT_104447 [Penicilliopsis zonata CBS 506.65]